MTEETKINEEVKEIPKPRWALDRDILDLESQLNPLYEQKRKTNDAKLQIKKEISESLARQLLGKPYETLDSMMTAIEKDREENYQKRSFSFRDYDKKIYETPLPFAVQFLSEIQKYSDEIRLVIAYELDTKKYLRFSCYHDFDHYKTPSECGKCNTAEENVQRAGLIKYFKSAGERVFKTDKDQVEKIILKAVYSLDDMNKRFEFVNRISKVRDAPAVDENLISELRGKLEILKKYKTEEKEKGTNALQAMRKDFMELFVTLNKEITNTGVEKYVAEYLNK